jgi:hypothetical protein
VKSSMETEVAGRARGFPSASKAIFLLGG